MLLQHPQIFDLAMGVFLCLLVLPVAQLTLEKPMCRYQQHFGDIGLCQDIQVLPSTHAVSTKRPIYLQVFYRVSAHLSLPEEFIETLS